MRRITQGLKTTLGRTRVFLGLRLSVGGYSSAAACVAFGTMLGLLLLLLAMIPITTSANQNEGETSRLLAVEPITARTTLACNKLATASLAGPITGKVGVIHTFTVAVSPSNADLPITYTWQATGQIPKIHTVSKLTDTIGFGWPISGSQHVTVTALNCLVASATDSLIINIEQWHTYLPLALKRYLYDPHEPNDTRGQAYGPLVSGRTYIGFFPDAVDRNDYYKIDIFTKEKVSAQLGVPDRIDLNLWVYDAAGQYITGSGLMGDGLDEALEFEPAATGTYYLRVHRPVEGPGQEDPYALVATFDTP